MDDHRMPDEAIIDLFFARDEQAIREADAVYGKDLMRLALRILSSREDAEETKNDTYLTSWKSIPPIRPLRLSSFLLKICRNLALDRLDARKAKKRSAQMVEFSDELKDSLPGSSLEEEIENRELWRLITEFLDSLP